jgi:hypothetical protein
MTSLVANHLLTVSDKSDHGADKVFMSFCKEVPVWLGASTVSTTHRANPLSRTTFNLAILGFEEDTEAFISGAQRLSALTLIPPSTLMAPPVARHAF